jgi:hypothetical protein
MSGGETTAARFREGNNVPRLAGTAAKTEKREKMKSASCQRNLTVQMKLNL